MIQNESVLPDNSDHSFQRTISIARPSLRNDILSEDDFMSGVMEKQSPSLLKRWQKRYFVLSNKVLKYFKTEQDYLQLKPPKGVLNFQQIWIEPEFKDLQMKIFLKLMGSNRVFNLRCQSQDEFEVWQKKLRHSLISSIGKLKELSMEHYKDDYGSLYDFWRFMRIDEEAFILNAEVGDMILSKSKNKI